MLAPQRKPNNCSGERVRGNCALTELPLRRTSALGGADGIPSSSRSSAMPGSSANRIRHPSFRRRRFGQASRPASRIDFLADLPFAGISSTPRHLIERFSRVWLCSHPGSPKWISSPQAPAFLIAGRFWKAGSDQIEERRANDHAASHSGDPNSPLILTSLSVTNARLRLHGVSSYGRSHRPKPCGRDDFPLGAEAPIPREPKSPRPSGPPRCFGLAPIGASVRGVAFAAITDSHRNRGRRPNDGEQDEDFRGIPDPRPHRQGS